MKYVRVFRVSLMYGKQFSRLEVTIQDASPHQPAEDGHISLRKLWEDALKPKILSIQNVTELEGTAPRGDLEHQLQAMLDEMQSHVDAKAKAADGGTASC